MYQVDIENDAITKHDLTNLSPDWQPSTEITGSTVDKEGNVYFSTKLGLLQYDGSDWSIANTANANLPFENLGFVEVNKDKIITGGKEGVFTIEGERTTIFDHTNSNYPELTPFIYDSELYDGKLYLGTSNNLVVWDLETTSTTEERNYAVKLQYDPSTNTLKWDTYEQIDSHSIFDTNGRFIIKSSRNTLTVNDLKPGTYISRLILSKGAIYTAKFIKS